MVTDTLIQPSSILLYNTQNLDAVILKAQFSIRKKEYERIWQDIKSNSMQYPADHYLIQGVRGAGKTTLLSRLCYAVREEESLNSWLIPILFNEEEYGIFSLFTFWLRIAQKLALYAPERYEALYTQLMQLSSDEEIQAWTLIRQVLIEHKQKIIVFIDNLAELFDGFSDNENAQLREVLSLHPEIRIIGGSSVILDAHFDGLAPFYQFFKLVNLKAISEVEMHELLRTLAKHTSEEAIQRIEEIITQHPERIEAVRRLTDGVPRTIVLLFQIIMEGAKDSSFAYLEETIDKTTPLYKHRMDDLTRQQQVIVNAIAMNWDAMNVKEIAEQTRLPSKTISAQLTVLQKRWVVDKVETNTKNHLYLIKERFFNIWYLMRYGTQQDRRRVLWLTKFLESWYSDKELSLKLLETLGTLLVKEAMPKDLLVNALLASDKIDYDIRRNMAEKYKELSQKPVVHFSNEQQALVKREAEKVIQTTDDKAIYQFLEKNNDVLTLIDYITYSHRLYELGSSYFKPHEILLSKSPIGYIEAVHLFTAIYEKGLAGYKKSVIDVFESNFLASEDYFNVNSVLFCSIHLEFCLWDNQFEKVQLILDNFDKEKVFSSIEGGTGVRTISEVKEIFFDGVILLLLAKKQYEMAYHLFHQFQLTEILKPLYFATVYYLPDERHQEFLRMGYELHETLMEIFAVIKEYQIKYV